MTTSTFSTGIPGINLTGENTSVIRFIFCVFENAPFHPECPFAIASMTVLAFRWFEIAEVLKHYYTCLVMLSELDNACAHQMGYLLICVTDLAPEICIVLFAFHDNAS